MSSRSVAAAAAVALPPGADASAVAGHVETTVIAVPPTKRTKNSMITIISTARVVVTSTPSARKWCIIVAEVSFPNTGLPARQF